MQVKCEWCDPCRECDGEGEVQSSGSVRWTNAAVEYVDDREVEQCEHCEGTGTDPNCDECGGSGFVEDDDE